MKTEQINRCILSAYPRGYRAEAALSLDFVPTLSACRHWRIEASDGIFCLRRWPRGNPPLEQLQFQQALLWHVVCEGIEFVPLPLETRNHQGFVVHEGSYWELLPWLEQVEAVADEYFQPCDFPNFNPVAQSDLADDAPRSDIPDLEEPDSFQVVSAMMSLAQFHLAAASFPLPNHPVGISRKARLLLTDWEQGESGGFAESRHALQRAQKNSLGTEWIKIGCSLLDHAQERASNVLALLHQVVRVPVPIQTTLGNATFRHLRFDEEGLCGIIDFKNLAVDSVAWDIASLLGSMTEADLPLWTLGLKAYQSIRDLSENELLLVRAFDQARPLLEGIEWISKVLLQDKTFTKIQLQEIMRRLKEGHRRLDTEKQNRHSA